MDNDKARGLKGQAARTRQQWELAYGHRCEDWPDPLRQDARELRTHGPGQQGRLSRTLAHSTDLLSASADHADRVVAELEHGQWAKASGCAPGAETVQHKVERANELRRAIVAAAGALAVIAEGMAWIHRDRETCLPGSDGHQQLPDEVSETAGAAREAERATGHWS